MGLANEYELLKQATDNGLWLFKDDQEVARLKKLIEGKRKVMGNLVLKSQMNVVEAEIKKLAKELSNLENRKEGYLTNSLESKLREEKNDFIVASSMCYGDGQKVWKTHDDFMADDAEFVSQMTRCFFESLNVFQGGIVRAIARSTDARYRLKKHRVDPLFTTTLQIDLMQWCEFYTSIYDLSDRPDETVINDDSKLDGWLDTRKARAKAGTSVKSNGGFSTIPKATAEDMEILGGIGGAEAIQAGIAAKQEARK